MSCFSANTDGGGETPNLRLLFKKEAGRTILSESFSRMPFRIFPPFRSDDAQCAYTYVVNPSPGFLAGDRVRLEVVLDEGAVALVAGPSSTKVLATSPGLAGQTTHITIGKAAHLEYIPPYVIPFEGSRFRQKTIVHMERGSRCLLLDWFATGRVSRGEHLAFDEYDNSTVIECGGRPAVVDRFVLRPRGADYSRLGLLESYTVSACLYLIGAGPDSARALLKAAAGLRPDDTTLVAASRLDEGVVMRVLGKDMVSAQRAVLAAIALMRRGLRPEGDHLVVSRLLGAL